MKRNDDNTGGIIKIPDVSAVTASVAQQQLQQSVFVQRQPTTHIEMSSRPSVTSVGGSQISLPRAHPGGPAPGTTGVTVYRSDGGAVSNPPAAHSGGIAVTTTPSSAASSQQPPAAHIGGPSGMNQPPTNLKAEQITLPTTPVSLPYGTAVTTTYSGPSVPSIKTLTQSASMGSRDISVGHQIIQNKPHPTFPGIRTITTGGSIANIANAAAGGGSMGGGGPGGTGTGSAQFQRLKVEDALSYLDQVKYKFGNQPQVYNDFLDIMKEFKSQSIDTPGVIARVSQLFRGHPELIVGFNTFLPPGYKIEVQCNEAIAVSMPGILGAGMQTIVHTPHGIQTMVPQGPQLTSISQTVAPTTVRPVTIATSSGGGNSSTGPSLSGGPQKFGPTTVIKNSSDGSSFTGAHPLRLGSEVTMVPQNPPSGGGVGGLGGLSGTPHLLTTAASLPQPPQGPPNAGSGSNQPVNQPVEFNHAINYVNKIKNRFAGQPDVYKQFLEILHTYQKDQRAIKEGQQPTGRFLTEGEVFAQVAKLFQNQEDLLNEFSQFLPEATNDSLMPKVTLNNDHPTTVKRPGLGPNLSNFPRHPSGPSGPPGGRYQPVLPGNKRPPSGLSLPVAKKIKIGVLRDVTLSEAGKYGTLNEYAFFDKVRKALKNKDAYEDFLRCLVLFNQEVISRTELVQLTAPFLNRYPELFKWFKDFVGYKESNATTSNATSASAAGAAAALALAAANDHKTPSGASGTAASSAGANDFVSPQRERFSGDSAMDVDYATCKRLGASYCALPKNFVQPSCSGRSQLNKEVLNDTWVSFPSWSEDSQFVTSRKTQYEEFIYRTEDERFEFDVVLETNKDTIKVLECVQKKMSRMPPEEAARYRLDDCLGGSSPTIHQRAIKRIYGDKANDIIDGLKRNPVVAVPLVLRRLKSKDEEWREVQKNFNKTWREQNEKYYLKSLDHQSLLFKQTDTRFLRSKSLLNELETLYDERHEQDETNATSAANDEPIVPVPEGPHMTNEYSDFQILDDVNNLLIHHVKRQTSIHKEDKHKIKVLLKHFLMDIFKHPRQELSEDERDEDEDSEKDEGDDPDASNGSKSDSRRSRKSAAKKDSKDSDSNKSKDDGKNKSKNNGATSNNADDQTKSGSGKDNAITEADVKVEPSKDGRRTPLHARDMEPDESYSHIMCNNNWCLFLRLHNILSERLTKMYNQAVILANEETKDKKERKDSTAVALRLKPKNEIEPEDYYPAFLDMVKNLLDGNMDPQAYEDTLREMFGIHAYVSFTLDKVVSNCVRQMQHLVMDEACIDCYDLYQNEKKNGATGGYCGKATERQLAELLYQKRAEKLLSDENCFKVFIYHQSGKISIELLDTETEGNNSDQEEESARKYSSYVERFIQPGDEISDGCRIHLARKPVFLPRSIRSYNESPLGKKREEQAQVQHQQRNHVNNTENSKQETTNGDTNDKSSDESSPNAKKELFSMDKINSNVVLEDNLQCKFNPRNFKILYVINSENCFYRKLALTRAKNSHKAVSHRKQNDFKRWHSKWLSSNVSDSSKTSINEWFMGKCDGLVPNKTHKIVKNNLDITPYRTFYKYKAEILKTSSDEPTSLTSTSVNSGAVSSVSLNISAATGNSSNSAKTETETGSS